MLFEFSGYVLQWSATEDIIISARCGWVLQVSCVRRFGSSKVGSLDQESIRYTDRTWYDDQPKLETLEIQYSRPRMEGANSPDLELCLPCFNK